MGTARSLFDRTLKPPYVFVRDRFATALDRRAGIHTEGHFTPEELGFSGRHRVRYKPSNWFALRRVLPPRRVSSEDVFIDFGSGMGRIVYQAASGYPFRRVIGVELSERMHAIAVENIERTRHRLRCADVELVCSDALEYEIPEDVSVVYLGNPFSGPVFATVLERLLATVERNPRRLRIVYFNPVEERRLLDAGFRVTKAIRGLRPGAEWSRSNSTRLYELSG
jgi:hypothetical protein